MNTHQRPRPDDGSVRILDIWQTLARRRRVVIMFAAAAFVIGVLVTALTTKQYRSSATIQIEPQGPEIFTFKDVVSGEGGRIQDFYQTQYRILTSRAVAKIAVDQVALTSRPTYVSRRTSPVSRVVRWVTGKDRTSPDETVRHDLAVEFVLQGLEIRPLGRSHLVEVAFTDADPELARDLANAVIESFEQFNMAARFSTTSRANEFLTKQVVQIQSEISLMERELQEIGAAKDIVTVQGGSYDMATQALADLTARLVESRGRLALSDARLRSLENGAPGELPEVIGHGAILRLRQQRTDLEQRSRALVQRFGEEWPELRSTRDQIRALDLRLESEMRAVAREVIGAATVDRDRVRHEVENLSRQIVAQKNEIQRVGRDAIEFASVKAEIDSRRRFLNDLVGRQSETQVSDRLRDTRASNLRMIDRARLSERPVKPSLPINAALSILLGLTVGVAMAFVVDHLDNRIKHESEAMALTGLPLLGEITSCGAVAGSPNEPDSVALVSFDDPASAFSEAFKNLRTTILLSSPERPPRHLVITSSEPGDGKSTVSANLAVVLSQMGRRILLVDADLRRPRVHRVFELDNRVGLSNYLSGSADLADIVQTSRVPGLDVVTGGPVPPMPSELLDAPRLGQLLGAFGDGGAYDHVIFDSTPALGVSDSVILAARTDATVLVIRSGKTTRDAVAQAMGRLRHARAQLVGVVMNGVTKRTDSQYYALPENDRAGEAHAAPSATSIASRQRVAH